MAARLQGIDLQPQSAYLQHMDWDKLQYFLSVAHHGTLARAAQALHVEPTPVSRRVTNLDADLQQTLLPRAQAGFGIDSVGRGTSPPAHDDKSEGGARTQGAGEQAPT